MKEADVENEKYRDGNRARRREVKSKVPERTIKIDRYRFL